ncbi:HNH endonuclease, partial [Salmonella enterica]|nr:HNH endonuclease [Salmonella enterica]
MSECIIWKGCVKNGYGWRTWRRQTTTAHRIEYCIAKGIAL